MKLLELAANLATRWRHLHWLPILPPDAPLAYWFQIWSPDGANCISCKFGLQMTSVVLVPNLVTIWHHLHLLQSWLSGNLNQFESLSLSNRRGMPCCICVNDVKVETESLNAEKEYCSGGCFPFKLAIAIAPLTYSTVRSSWVFAAVEEFFHWIPLP